MFWVDEIVADILKKVKKNDFLICDWKTPSGHVHVGSLRGIIIHDLVRRGLEEEGRKAVFQFGFDDFDPMDGLPVYIDKSWRQHMGKPLCNVPAPDGKAESFAQQYADEFIKVFNNLGIKPIIVFTSQLYKEGKFDKTIKIILDNAEEIKKIYKEISGSDKGADWLPLQVVCPKCGKIGTTKVTGWDGKFVKFSCQENLVEWAKGCGYSGEISPFSSNAKLPWKVEWPAKWFVFGTDIEGEGKDHFAAGGSRDVANAIFKEVFKKTPPYDIRYEHFLVGGAKMSSSKGVGVTAKDIADVLPANILRFLFSRTKYKRTIDFQPEGEAIPLLYDEYDRSSDSFLKDPKSDLGGAFYYSEINPNQAQPKYNLRFSKVAHLTNGGFKYGPQEYAQEEKGSELSDLEKKELESRIETAKKWLDLFAPESYKISIALNSIPGAAKNLTAQQKEFLQKLAQVFGSKDKWSGEDLHKEIHNLKNDMKIAPKDAFSAIYLIFIGKDSGPQAGWFLASLDKNFVLKRLKEVINA